MYFQRSRGEALAAWNYFSCCFSRTSKELTTCFMSIMPFSQCRHSSLALLRHWAEILGFSGGSDGKESTCNSGDLGFSPWVGKIPVEGNGYPLHYSCLENSMDRWPWRATVHGVAKSWTWLNNTFATFTPGPLWCLPLAGHFLPTWDHSALYLLVSASPRSFNCKKQQGGGVNCLH